MLAVLLVLAACQPPAAQGRLEVSADNPRQAIAQGNDFDIVLSMRNVSAYNAHVRELRLPAEFMQQVTYVGSSPGLTMNTNAKGEGVIAMDLTIAPTGAEQILFRFNSMAQGDLYGLGLVTTDLGSYQFEMKASLHGSNPGGWQPQTSATLAPDDLILGAVPYQAVVQIKALVEVDGETGVGWTGSGTLISRDGLILTNAHVVLSDRFYQVKNLVVALTLSQDHPPVDTYYASIVQADAQLDMAVIKVRSDLNGHPLDYASLNLPAVPLGNSDNLQLGDTLTILGYPGIGGETITLTRGDVSGFTNEEPYGARAYIKTSATIAGGNSGGLAVDSDGRLVGVPTKLGAGDENIDLVDCRPLYDTNRDGYVDENDSCVPTGGFINAIRPVNLAMDIVKAAQAGHVAIETDPVQAQVFQPTGQVIYQDNFSDPKSGWADVSDENGSSLYTEGGYAITVLQPNYLIWDSVGNTQDNVVVSVDTRVLHGVGDADYGLICGQDDENFYALEISEDGYYAIWKLEGDQSVYLMEWTYSEAIATGSSHKLQAQCGSSGLLLALNGVTLGAYTDPSYKPGLVGLITGTYDQVGIRVLFDNFTVMKP